jgi:hypothetical protein
MTIAAPAPAAQHAGLVTVFLLKVNRTILMLLQKKVADILTLL